MNFRKLKETVAAFRTRSPKPTIQDEIDEYAKAIQESLSGEAPKKIVRLGVYIAAVLPSSLLIAAILERLTRFEGAMLGAAGILVGGVIASLITHFHDSIMNRIPFHKLNPFFGNKLDETIEAFKKSR